MLIVVLLSLAQAASAWVPSSSHRRVASRGQLRCNAGNINDGMKVEELKVTVLCFYCYLGRFLCLLSNSIFSRTAAS
jgi:hypothetical protein